MPFLTPYPTPLDVPIAGTQLATEDWLDFFLRQQAFANQTVRSVVLPVIENIGAAVPATPLAVGVLSSGFYRLSAQVRVSLAAGVSSAIGLTVRWTHGGARSKAFAAVATNDPALPESLSLVARLDAPGVITWETTYASNPAGVMRHALEFALERLG